MLNDRELDLLLENTSQPKASAALASQVLNAVAGVAGGNIMAFPQRRQSHSWAFGVPLAASLILGIWLGASGSTANLWTPTVSSVASTENADALGLEDIENLIEDELT